jgi:hypothetical protein
LSSKKEDDEDSDSQLKTDSKADNDMVNYSARYNQVDQEVQCNLITGGTGDKEIDPQGGIDDHFYNRMDNLLGKMNEPDPRDINKMRRSKTKLKNNGIFERLYQEGLRRHYLRYFTAKHLPSQRKSTGVQSPSPFPMSYETEMYDGPEEFDDKNYDLNLSKPLQKI